MELPLFPLNSVLFPGATLPLHIFEDRYKEMIGRCLQQKAPFGVVLIRSGREVGEVAEPFEVGTMARIVRVQRLDEGRLNLACVGERRFRTTRHLRDTPYLVGEVEPLETTDWDTPETAELADTVSALFGEYYRLYLAVSNQWSRGIGMPGPPDTLADFVGSRLAVDLWTKQRLLEELSAAKRLQTELDILSDAIRDMTPKVEAARAQRWRALAALN